MNTATTISLSAADEFTSGGNVDSAASICTRQGVVRLDGVKPFQKPFQKPATCERVWRLLSCQRKAGGRDGPLYGTRDARRHMAVE